MPRHGSTPMDGAPSARPARRTPALAWLGVAAVLCVVHLAGVVYGLTKGGPFVALAVFGVLMLCAAAVILPRGLTAGLSAK